MDSSIIVIVIVVTMHGFKVHDAVVEHLAIVHVGDHGRRNGALPQSRLAHQTHLVQERERKFT